MKEFKEY